MKSTVRFAAIAAPALAISAAAFLMAANLRLTESSGLTVHEWGTFTSVAAEDGSAVEWDTLGCTSDLPRFIEKSYGVFKSALVETVRMETPVMYFYSSRDLDAHVTVRFPKGLITEWFPRADNQTGTGTIEWKNIKVQPNSFPALPIESEPSHYYAARQTDSAPIAVGDQHEKFLFYRGVGHFPVPLSVRVSPDEKIVVENRGLQPVPTVILFENRGGRFGYRNAGTVASAATLDSPSLDGSLSVLQQELENALVAQGLFPKEAEAMVETWHDSWFEEGSRLIYILPTPAVDAILPLQVEPAPSQTVRVFVGRIELVTPEMTRTVESAIAKRDWAAIGRYNIRFLNPILTRIYPADRSRVNGIEQVVRSAQGGSCR
jgi:hypothetical protein